MKAIIYTSNAGSTVQYAQLLADELHLPVYSAKEAKKKVPAHSEIIYLGWIMAGGIKGYKDMVKKYNVRAVCAVGMSRTGTQTEEVRAIPFQRTFHCLHYRETLIWKNCMVYTRWR